MRPLNPIAVTHAWTWPFRGCSSRTVSRFLRPIATGWGGSRRVHCPVLQSWWFPSRCRRGSAPSTDRSETRFDRLQHRRVETKTSVLLNAMATRSVLRNTGSKIFKAILMGCVLHSNALWYLSVWISFSRGIFPTALSAFIGLISLLWLLKSYQYQQIWSFFFFFFPWWQWWSLFNTLISVEVCGWGSVISVFCAPKPNKGVPKTLVKFKYAIIIFDWFSCSHKVNAKWVNQTNRTYHWISNSVFPTKSINFLLSLLFINVIVWSCIRLNKG